MCIRDFNLFFWVSVICIYDYYQRDFYFNHLLIYLLYNNININFSTINYKSSQTLAKRGLRLAKPRGK